MFGFSFINCHNYSDLRCDACDDLPVLELTPNQLSSPPTAIFIRHFHDKIHLHLRRLAEKSLTQSITEQSSSIQRSFVRHFSQLLELPEWPIHSATFDFGIERAIEAPQHQSALIKFFKQLAPPIIKSPFPILLPVRIPLQLNVSGAEYRQFLNNLVINNIAFSIDIHPHELAGKEFSPEKLLRLLRFDIDLIRFIYEPEVGNHLVPKAVIPWLNYLNEIAYHGDIIFCPAGGDAELFEQEYHNSGKLSQQFAPSRLE